MRICSRLALATLLTCSIACPSTDDVEDTGVADTGVTPDTGGDADTGVDTGVEGDTGVGLDGDLPDMGTPPEELALGPFCRRTGEARAARLRRCSRDPIYEDQGIIDGYVSVCEAVRPEVEADRLLFDPVVALDCVVEIETATVAPCDALELPLPAVCASVFTANTALGEDCYSTRTDVHPVFTDVCVSGFCAIVDQCPGACTAYPAVGEACVATTAGNVCDPDSICVDATNLCALRPGNGDPCTFATGCQSGLICQPNLGICVSPGTDGSTCKAPFDCANFSCLDAICKFRSGPGGECVIDGNCPDTLICAARTCRTPVQVGQACVPNECDAGLQCVNDVCVQRPAVGEPCGGATCQEGLWCRQDPNDPQTQTCTLLGNAGDDCTDGRPNLFVGTPCAGDLYCGRTGVCQAAGGIGDPCRSDFGPSCVPEVWCGFNDVCTAPAADTEACSPVFLQGACAEGLGCRCDDVNGCPNITETNHACAPYNAPGAACTEQGECEYGCLGTVCGETPPLICVAE